MDQCNKMKEFIGNVGNSELLRKRRKPERAEEDIVQSERGERRNWKEKTREPHSCAFLLTVSSSDWVRGDRLVIEKVSKFWNIGVVEGSADKELVRSAPGRVEGDCWVEEAGIRIRKAENVDFVKLFFFHDFQIVWYSTFALRRMNDKSPDQRVLVKG